MSGIQLAFATEVLQLIFNATAIANIADNAGSSPLTDVQISLHTADPTAVGDQTTNECAYTSYARQAITRNSSNFAVVAGSVSPVAQLEFPTCTGGSETAKYIGFGTAGSGAGKLLFSGALTPNIGIFTGIKPIVGTSSTISLS